MNSIYTTSVKNVPEKFNEPTSTYKKHVWIAVAGIITFFAFYSFLTYWFFSSAYRLLGDAFGGGNSSLVTIGIGIACLFLGIFMIKAFFFVQTKHDVQDRQIKPEDEPVLFDFLHKLADEIGAPRPSKVYLSNRVNASVFYDLSIFNLFFPSKKNLEIGIGLINVLNLGEFKAVLAHEYGHFAQKSMLVGRWVYIANQIANTIITRRDALDSFLRGLSRIDLRIAWIGWILSIIVWSIRSLVELIFRVVVLSQRALSREMEFQADLVSVSVTGSDALIHALHKLQAADAALSDAMSALSQQLEKGKAIEDLYAIQSNAIERTAYVLNDDEYGKSPKIPEINPENHRVFSDKIAQPPKMWLTHPPDQEREANAKQNYISGEIDDRSSWELFTNPKQIRTQLTNDLIASTKVETELISTTESIAFHNKQFDRSYFNPSYRGVYLNRFFCKEYESSEDIYLPELKSAEAEKVVSKLYPPSLVEELEDFTTLQEELLQLEAIQEKRLTASGEGGIWHRGTQIRRKELPKVIGNVKSEVNEAKSLITDHDRLTRTVHLRLAENMGQGWDNYLKGLLSIIHYSEHNIHNIQDAHRSLSHVLTVVMADNKVSSSELKKLIYECSGMHAAIADVERDQGKITLDDLLVKELEIEEDKPLFEKFAYPPANEENINNWIANIDGWIHSYIRSLTKLRSEALELLLRTEEQVQQMHQSKQIKHAPSPSVIETKYNILPSGKERALTLKLNMWDKFISAEGIFPALAKFAVAASIVGGTVYLAGLTGNSDLSIYNGLGQTVMVDLNGQKIKVKPHSHKKTDFKSSGDYEISTKTLDGETIESFEPELSSTSSHYVYNVARAAALYEYRIYYGGNPVNHQNLYGNKRWLTTTADYIFEEAPQQMKTSSKNVTKDVLMGLSDANIGSIFNALPEESQQMEFIKSHTLWDPSDAPNVLQLVSMASSLENSTSLLQQRLISYPDEILTLRLLMDSSNESERNNLCKEYDAKSKASPTNPNAYYIATRCLPEGPEKEKLYIEGSTKWPDHSWMNYAASHYYAKQNNWEKSYDALQTAYDGSESLKPVIGLNAARVLRFLKAQGKTVKNTRRLESTYLDYYELLEAGNEKDPYVKVHYLINNGELQEAMDLAETLPDIRTNITAVCAASDGGKKAWIDSTLNTSPDSLNDLGILAVTGLALRKNLDISAFSERLEAISSQQEISTLEFIEKIKSRNYNAAQEIMSKSGLVTYGQLCTVAYIAYGNKIPLDWKLKAQTLLFASEKPYMKAI